VFVIVDDCHMFHWKTHQKQQSHLIHLIYLIQIQSVTSLQLVSVKVFFWRGYMCISDNCMQYVPLCYVVYLCMCKMVHLSFCALVALIFRSWLC